MIAAAALRRHARAPIAVPILLALSGSSSPRTPPPLGPTGLGLFILAVLLVRSQATGRSPAPVVQPGSA